jgi:hypothetical protein
MSFSNNSLDNPTKIEIVFRFDKTHWQPVFTIATGHVDFDLPNERLPISEGINIKCYNPDTNLVDENGCEIRIIIDPSVAMLPGSYSFYPSINISSYGKNKLLMLPFRRKVVVPLDNAFSLGICIGTTNDINFLERRIDESLVYQYPLQMFAWNETYTSPCIITNGNGAGGGNLEATQIGNNVQAVDWLYKSPEIGDGKVGLKPRGTITQMSSRGSSTNKEVKGKLGLYNVLVSTNYKQYQGQILDYVDTVSSSGSTTSTVTSANDLTKNKETNITSIWDNNTDAVSKVFGDKIKLGDITNPAVGNYLVDREIFVNKVTSDGTRGERFSYTLFGHVKSFAEKLYIKSSDAIFKVIGSVRRTGR